MKQFLTLCMAAAMIGSATNADAKITLEQAQKLKSEGKAMTAPLKARTSTSKSLKQVPVSGFHKMKCIKDAKSMKKAPMKAAPNGDSLFGYVGYADDYESEPMGLYEIDGDTPVMQWADPFFVENMVAASNMVKIDDKVLAVYLDQFWGMIFGIYYAEYDFESGELLNFVEQDLNEVQGFFQVFAYNDADQMLYGFGAADGEQGFISAPADDPMNYTMVRPYQDDENICISFCYNPVDEFFYGVTIDYNLVRIGTDGVQEVVMPLDVFGGATYITGLVFNPASNLFYWNINLDDDVTSLLATIDPTTQTLDVVAEFQNAEEIMNFFTLDEANPNPLMPNRPEVAGKPDFFQGNLVGKVPFKLPTDNKGGDKYEDDLEYVAYLNGELYSTGKAAPGSEVSVAYAVPEPGTYSFSLTVRVDSLESSPATARAWVGNDVPAPVWDVRMTNSEVSWSYYDTKSEFEGIHGGYVDKREVEYIVNILKFGEPYGDSVKADSWKSTSVAIELPEEDELVSYTAQVIVKCNGLESAPVNSNAVAAGVGLKVEEGKPIVITPTPEEFNLCITLDNNGDGSGWQLNSDSYGEPYAYSGWSPSFVMDDWLFLPKMTFDDPAKFYTFSMDVALYSESYPEEYIEVLLCNEPTPRGVLMPAIIDEFSPASSQLETKLGYFRARQPGDYYIAIHCTSEADQWGVVARNFTVADEGITFASPGTVENLTVTAGAPGELKATVEFDMPTLTLGENEIDAATELEARITTPEDEIKVVGKPGEHISKIVDTAQGINTIEVRVYDGDKAGLPMAEEVFTGWNEPSLVTGVTAVVSDDMQSVTMTWAPVTTGWVSEEDPTGGIVDPETIVYDVCLLEQSIFGNMLTPVAEDLTEPTYTFVADEQNYYTFVILSRNEAGSVLILDENYADAIVGTPYSLPMEETFEDGTLSYQPWMIYRMTELAASWSLDMIANLTGNSSDEGYCIYGSGIEGIVSRLGVPRFSTSGLESVKVSMDVLPTELPNVKVYAECAGTDPVEIAEITKTGKVEFELPAEFVGKGWVGLLIEAEFTEDGTLFAMSNITIESADAVGNVNVANLKISGEKGQIKVTGLNGQDVTVANTNGAIVGKAVKASNDAIFNVEKGIYVVKAGNKKAKVVVK